MRVLDQAKRFAPGKRVDANDVRALFGVMMSDPSATNAVVTTTSDFAPMIQSDPFIKPNLSGRLELINGIELVNRLKGLA